MKGEGAGKKTGKKIQALLLAIVLMTGTVGCGQQVMHAEDDPDEQIRIVCTIFPEYDWVKQILGDQAEEAELTLLLKNGADLHSYQPTVWDLKAISEADLFLYVGGESDFWVEQALANMKDPDCRTLNLMELLESAAREEEQVEGMQTVRGHEHDPDAEEGRAHESEASTRRDEEAEYDEHLWLSLRNAQAVCGAITEALCELDGRHRELYEQNCRSYQEKLHALDRKYVETVEEASVPVLLFGDRFPFRYLMEDYGITYYAAFAGCAAETEASFETVAFLADKAGELRLPAVLKIDGSDGAVARTIAGNTETGDQKVLLLDSMQSVSRQEIEEGENYLSVMERNLEVLKEAFSTDGE